ncbi:TPA: hypothetical protein EYP66_20765 [Candidatus Poribacteria bacterium]|nr:hypothetical protein [Candidatus Poribacteria bacterium]
MAIKCPKCGNANPDNARYCWHDGAILTTQSGLNPFRFRHGAVANSLTELGAQVDSNWEDGKYHLYSGDFANWLSGIGRGDLSSIARNIVSQEKNENIGVEKFLQSFGVDAPPLPKLTANEASLDFGRVDVNLISSGKYTKQFSVANPGRGYLYGNISSSVSWLQLDTSDFNGNNITVTATAVKPGKRGTIIIRSNAGTKRVPVTMEPIHPWWKPVLMYGGIGTALGVIRIIIAMIHLAVYEKQFGIWLFSDISSSTSKLWLINYVWFINHAIILSIIGAIGGVIWHKIKWSRFASLFSGAVAGSLAGIVIFFLFLPLDHALVYIIHHTSLSDTNRMIEFSWVVVICWSAFGLFIGIATGVCRWLVRIHSYFFCAIPVTVFGIILFMLWAMGNTVWGNQIADFLFANIGNWL